MPLITVAGTRRTGRRRMFMACAAAAVAITAAGCGTPSAAASGPGRLEKASITIGALPTIGDAAIYIAQDKGLFRRAGLRVRVVPLGAPQTVVPDLERGRFDVLEYEWTTIIQAEASGGAKLHAIAPAQALGPRSQEIVVLPHSGVTSASQLRGKPIGVQSLNGLDSMIVDAALSSYGITPGQVHLVAVPFQDMGQALATREVAAAEPAEPYVTLLENNAGAAPLADMDQGGMLGFPVAGYTVTDQFARAYPRTTAALARVLGQAQVIAATSRAAVERAITQGGQVSRSAAGLVAFGSFPTTVDAVQLQRVADTMLTYHELSQRFAADVLTRPAR